MGSSDPSRVSTFLCTQAESGAESRLLPLSATISIYYAVNHHRLYLFLLIKVALHSPCLPVTHAIAYVWATNSPAFASFNSLPPSPPSRAAWSRPPALIKPRGGSSTGLISGVPAIGNAASVCQGPYHEKEGSVELFEASTDQQEAKASAGAATDRLELRGPIIDLLTPFTSEGDVDFAAFGQYLRFLAQAGVQTVLCNGEAGEFESLTIDERRVLLDLARATFAGTVLNHVSASALPDVTRLISRSSREFRDGPRTMADAVVLMAPFAQSRSRFGGVTRVADEVGSEAFLRRALKGCDLPVFLYSSPGSPISPELYNRLSEDFPAIRGIVCGGGDAEFSMELKKALPLKHLLLAIGDRGPRVGGERAPSANAISAAETAGADACIMTASSPLAELAVRMQACLDRGDRSGARHAQRELEMWTKKRQTVAKASESEVSVVKAAVGARVPGFPLHTRPPLQDLNREAAEDVMRWVSNNEGVRREKRSAHIRRISCQLSDVYRRVWNSVEVAGLEVLFEQLSASEERLLGYLENAKRQRAELDERSAMSASESEVEAARLLSDVMDARRRLEEDADREVSVEVMPTAKEMPTAKKRSSATDSACAGLKERLEDAKAIAARSQGRLGSLRSLNALAGAESTNQPFDSGERSCEELVENAAAPAVVTDFDHADRDPEEMRPVVSSLITPSTNGDLSGDVDNSIENTIDNSVETSVFDLVNGDMSEPVNGDINGGICRDVSSGDVRSDSASHDVSLSGAEFSTETARPIPGKKKVSPTPPIVPSSSLVPEEHTAASSGNGSVPAAPSIGELAWGATSKNSAPGVNGAVGDAASAGAGVAAVATRMDAAEEMEAASTRITSFQHGSGVGWKGDRGRFGPAELPGGRFGDPEDGSAFGASGASAASGWDPTSLSTPYNAQSLPQQQQQQPNQAEPDGDYRNEQPWQRGGSMTNSVVDARPRIPEEQTSLAEEETMASSPAQALDPRAPWLREAMPRSGDGEGSGAQESLETRAVFGGSGGGEATSGPDVYFEKPRSKAQSNSQRMAALPTPRYGRYIPEGSPPKTPKTLSPAFPFQANPATSASRPHSRRGQSRQPPPRHHHNHIAPSKRERWTTALGEGGNGDLGGRGGRKDEVDGQIGVESRRGGLQWGQNRGGVTEKFEATVDDFREKEKETFFKSKGIDGDVDSFDWDQLRRNTLEIENLQREAVDRYRRRQGGDPDHWYPRR